MALPGVTTVLKDRFYTLTQTNPPAGPRVLGIATRNTADGTEDTAGNAVMNYDPYSPRTEADCIAAFGNGSGCHRVYLELAAGGASRISVVAVPSGTADSALTGVVPAAFDAAETARPDIIVPWGRGGHPNDWQQPATPGDDLKIGFSASDATLAQAIASKCQEISDRSHPVFAVMGVAPYIGTSTAATENIVAANIATHLGMSAIPDHNGTFANGQYLSVVVGELNVAGYPQNVDRSKAGDFGYSNGAGIYAAQISQIDPWVAMTGKSIFNVTGMRYNATRTQQETLIGKGLVPSTLDFNRVPVWVDGLTFGKETSDYSRLTTLRIAFAAVLGCRQVAQGFIGQAATLQNRNALDTAVRSMLRGMTQLGAIMDSDFIITYIPRANKAIIDLVLQPVFELRNIEIQIAVDL